MLTASEVKLGLLRGAERAAMLGTYPDFCGGAWPQSGKGRAA
jgi:hypothetical protein